METCKGQSVKHITISCSKHGNMIIPKFCTQQSSKLQKKKKKKKKNLNRHFVNKMVCTPQHKTLNNA